MDDLERAVTRRLRARSESVAAPPGLAERVHAGVRRARRRRRTAEIIGVIASVALVIGVPAVGHLGIPRSNSPRLASSVGRPPVPGVSLDRLVSISRTLPGGRVFNALALAADGTVVGRASDDTVAGRVDGRYATGRTVATMWRSGPEGGAPRIVADTSGLWAARTDGKRVIWPQNTDSVHDFQLMCAEDDAAPRQLGSRGVASEDYAFTADGGAIVWNDEAEGTAHTVWAARSCDDRPRPVFRGGAGVAFCYPDVLVAGERPGGGFDGRLTDVDVDSGTAVPLLPSGADELTGHEDASFAANKQVLAWADDRALTVLDRRTGRAHTLPVRLPHSSGVHGESVRLTAGNRLLVYSTGPQDGDPAAATSLVYDLRTARSTALPGDAYAAGDWLVWREGPDYHLARLH